MSELDTILEVYSDELSEAGMLGHPDYIVEGLEIADKKARESLKRLMLQKMKEADYDPLNFLDLVSEL